MNTSCPICTADLSAKRYSGVIRPRCPECRTFLTRNIHPTEEQNLAPEIPLVCGALIGVLIGYLISSSTAVVGVLGVFGATAGVALYFVRNRSAVPPEWQRWVVDLGMADTSEPSC